MTDKQIRKVCDDVIKRNKYVYPKKLNAVCVAIWNMHNDEQGKQVLERLQNRYYVEYEKYQNRKGIRI
jgi:hypothetical protein